jgi:hypothetical protein
MKEIDMTSSDLLKQKFIEASEEDRQACLEYMRKDWFQWLDSMQRDMPKSWKQEFEINE